MTRTALLAVFLLLAAGLALAGPNAGGVLLVHDTGLVLSTDPRQAYPSPVPYPCESEIDDEAPLGTPPGGAGWVWKIYAASPGNAHPCMKGVAMGATFPGNVFVVEAGPADPSDFSIGYHGWPQSSGGGVAISFARTRTHLMDEIYWLGGHGYATPARWVLGPHPIGMTVFVDDSIPPHEDLVADLGAIGFGMPGSTPCPPPHAPLACCFLDHHCEYLQPDECEAAEGTVAGDACDPSPCGNFPSGACCYGATCVVQPVALCTQQGGEPRPGMNCEANPCVATPIERASWGHIKADFR